MPRPSQAGATGKLLGRLFQHAFAVAKQVRTDTSIGNSPVSVAFAAVSLARQIFSDLSNQCALLIGAGETIELAARHLHRHLAALDHQVDVGLGLVHRPIGFDPSVILANTGTAK